MISRGSVMKKLRFAVIGTGFWANYQIPAWFELDGIELVAVYNRTRQKAEDLASRFHVPAVYDDVATLLDREQPDFVDIITDVDTHAAFTGMAASRGIPVICQKPMAPRLDVAREMVRRCAGYNTPLFIHENWRWQAPIRKLRAMLDEQVIGRIFKSRVTFCSAFPVFDNQPFLATLDEFILTDIGSHILDVCRFLFGEAGSVYCQTASVNPAIKGEDAAQVMMKMTSGATCYAEMSYASILEREAFPQTLILIEGEHGSIHLTHDYKIITTTRNASTTTAAAPVQYAWADPAYALVHSSIVACNQSILHALKGTGKAETTGDDNLKTVTLVHACYESARRNALIDVGSFSHGQRNDQ